ncbi:MAG: lysine--tRNA ligase, partial [Candidatus Aminicenantes bacterium]|nr:lysine--tRNA ligase [Candidatus Aminicenantes bacterium]
MEEQFAVRQEKLKKLAALGIMPYPYRFEVSHRFKDVIAKYKDLSADELKEVPGEIRCAGRIMAIRSMGKSAF